ncbi:ABC transporter permease subunit [Sphingomonas oligophenolica]|uniref:ABC transporter permease subunit n=1 Tax=Sphingomonas oligophenolica TaxID=301154 RepID=A0ABU9Y689_9SPHN
MSHAVAARSSREASRQVDRLVALLYAACLIAASVLAAVYIENLYVRRGIQFGFRFLSEPAAIPIDHPPIAYYAYTDGYARALLVGAINTLKVSLSGIVFATLLGAALGLALLARHPLVSLVARIYIEALRNVPILLQLMIWYALLLHLPARDRPQAPESTFVLSNRGLSVPMLGAELSPEFCALILGLSAYFACYIAEIVRSGVLGVPRGQVEAAHALGLRPFHRATRIILPQALRLIIPPLGNQYANLVKTSSMAVAIGYQDIVSIANATMTQTGQALEAILLIMVVYLTINSAIGIVLFLYERSGSNRAR